MSRQDELEKLIREHTRRLQVLKEQQARQGISVDPKIPLEIEDIETELSDLKAELEVLPDTIGQNPYRGLAAFREQDAAYFFGREDFTTQLVERVQRRTLVAVLGSSGSGKSSIVFAGLVPHLRCQGTWLIVSFRPSREPFRAIAASLLPLLERGLTERLQLKEIKGLAADLEQSDLTLDEVIIHILEKSPGANRFLLIADQFEELYTLCPKPEIRRRFLDVLLAAKEQVPLHRVLTLRADFMGQALGYRPVADGLNEAILMLGPMEREELRQAIEKPAEMQGGSFQSGLVGRILDDLGDEPGNLPLLEFALTALWEQQARGQLTHKAYGDIGGVDGALSRHAEQVFAGLDAAHQEQARCVFVQLVQPGEGTEDTRRLAHRDELPETDWALVQQLATHRLVVTGRDSEDQETVELVHEALIRNWTRLREWMKDDRRFRIWQERLRTIMQQWHISQGDEGALLRGAPLAEAEIWLGERGSDLAQAERDFIQASVALRKRKVEAEAKAKRQDEWFLWSTWMAVNIVGWAFGWAAGAALGLAVEKLVGGAVFETGLGLAMTGPMRGAMNGAVAGTMQSLVLRQRGFQASRWVLATTVGVALGNVATVTAITVIGKSALPGALVWALITATFGVVAGTAQWPVLRRQVFRAGWWVLASILSWAVLGAVGGVAYAGMDQANLDPALTVVGGAIAGFVSGAVVGAITGIVLVRLMRHPK